MNRLFLLLPLFIFSMGFAYAEPLDEIQVSVLSFDNNDATVQITWNQDEKIMRYQIGCVSCIPNTEYFTTDNNIIINNITPISNDSMAILYVLAYDFENEIIAANQIFVDLEQ